MRNIDNWGWITQTKMKKTMLWSLKQLPTVAEVVLLIDKKVITKEEAREMLFNRTEELPTVPKFDVSSTGTMNIYSDVGYLKAQE